MASNGKIKATKEVCFQKTRISEQLHDSYSSSDFRTHPIRNMVSKWDLSRHKQCLLFMSRLQTVWRQSLQDHSWMWHRCMHRQQFVSRYDAPQPHASLVRDQTSRANLMIIIPTVVLQMDYIWYSSCCLGSTQNSCHRTLFQGRFLVFKNGSRSSVGNFKCQVLSGFWWCFVMWRGWGVRGGVKFF